VNRRPSAEGAWQLLATKNWGAFFGVPVKDRWTPVWSVGCRNFSTRTRLRAHTVGPPSRNSAPNLQEQSSAHSPTFAGEARRAVLLYERETFLGHLWPSLMLHVHQKSVGFIWKAVGSWTSGQRSGICSRWPIPDRFQLLLFAEQGLFVISVLKLGGVGFSRSRCSL